MSRIEFGVLLLLVSLSHPVGAQATPETRQQPIAITQVTLIDGTGAATRENMTVVITGDRISAIGKSGRVRIPRRAMVINGRGKYLIPGLIDTHVHLAWDLDRHFSISTADQLRLLYLTNGLTSIREASSRGLEQQTLAAREAAKRPDVFTPRIYASGRVDVQNIARYKATGAGDLTRRLIALGVDGIKIRYGLTLPDIRATVEEARGAGLPVWGHTYHWDDFTRDAVLAGVSGVTHVQGLSPLGPRGRPDPPPVDTSDLSAKELYSVTRWLHADEAATDSLIALMIGHGVWLEPTLVTMDFVASAEVPGHPGSRYSVLPHEQTREGFFMRTGEDLGRYRAAFDRMKEFVQRFYLRGGVVLAGADGIPFVGFGIHDELRLLVEAGLPPMAALQAATLNAARALGWEKTLGTVQPGKQADLVLLDANPLADIRNTQAIRAVVTRGRLLSRGSLDSMLATAAALAAIRK